MSDQLNKIEREALSLSHQERAFLADRLLSSLDEKDMDDTDSIWIQEAEKRYSEYLSGGRKGVLAAEVFAEADRILK